MNWTNTARSYWTKFGNAALDAAYPKRCLLCATLGEDPVCPRCFGEFQALPFLSSAPEGITRSYAPYRYTGRAAQAVQRFKYNRVEPLGPWMAARLCAFVEENGIGDPSTLLVPIPIHWTRRWHRGFNQSEALCAEICGEYAPKALLRRRATQQMAGLESTKRAMHLLGAFKADTKLVSGREILLIDDVVTSGATASECAKSLLEAGADSVGLLTFCSSGYQA